MLIRTLSAIIALPILILLVILGGIWLQLGIAILSIIGLFEFYKAIEGKILPIHYVGFLMSFVYILLLDFQFNLWFFIFMDFFILSIMCLQVKLHKVINIRNIAITIFGFFYITFTFSNIYTIRSMSTPFIDFGLYIVWLVFISAWCCDTGAYFSGMFFGKHKLAPNLSPKKTIEGAIGGVFFACIGGILYGTYINCALIDVANNFKDCEINIVLISAIFASIGAIFSQIGDLSASSIKRYVNIKDFGYIMPGHGGVLDRFDSVIFTSSIIFIMCRFLI